MFKLYTDIKTHEEVTDYGLIENRSYFIELESPEEIEVISFLTNSKISQHLNWIRGNKTAELKIQNYIGQIRLFDKEYDVRSNKFSPELSGKEQLELVISDLNLISKKISFSYSSTAYAARTTDWLEIEKDSINKLIFLHQVFFSAPKEKCIKTHFQKIKQNPSLKAASKTKTDFIWNVRSVTPSILQTLNKKGMLTNDPNNVVNTSGNPRIELPINYLSYNSLENRFIKFFFQYTEQISLKIITSKSSLSNEIKEKANELLKQARIYLNDAFFADVTTLKTLSTNSTVLSSRDGYRDIFSTYIMSLFSIKHIYQDYSDGLSVDLKKISTLYEIWCFYLISYHILGEAITVTRSQSIIKNGEIKNSTIFKNDEYEVAYNKTFSNTNTGSYSTTLRPDISVTNIETGKITHFDAKYRTESFINSDNDLIKNFKNDDIYKMHTYLDAIYNSVSSIVMYPGNTFCFFEKAEPSREIRDLVQEFTLNGVGAIPAVPGESNEILSGFLKRFFTY
ncbi:hypothetical protein GCM10009133_13580 [Cocleimonas flava]|uniref:Putative component of viral defense system (DUF524 family) n=1 Tax=Cocleimonas flava TaxID=634765 RepID=A0A4V2P907_9GAMM|nr:DUF2357 domain-containing protein [Cocleimonas flava]TCJ87725.1 putative component of viral defense system (DUF524 family) [Cocleimonas flava]